MDALLPPTTNMEASPALIEELQSPSLLLQEGQGDATKNSGTRQAGRLDRVKSRPVMATNDSSIESKRSVENLYYEKPHMICYFVEKTPRRSPLINRGYWLRMTAIERVVKDFLATPTNRRRIVVNLGCGYDPLPFQMLQRVPLLCLNTTFVDVDYPTLIQKKCNTIQKTPQLNGLLTRAIQPSSPGVVQLRSEQYLAIGCDLRELEKVKTILAEELDIAGSVFLLIGEVSIAYMEISAADQLISWASSLGDVQFALLEQILPEGPFYPFASVMLSHLSKQNSPLSIVKHYPTAQAQERRFLDLGWSTVVVRTLWDLWSDDGYLTLSQRISLNAVEPFDEWEDFAIFASHYVLVVAMNSRSASSDRTRLIGATEAVHHKDTSDTLPHHSPLTPFDLKPIAQIPLNRRFGALFHTGDIISHHGGVRHNKRLNTINSLTLGMNMVPSESIPPIAIEARVCHTMTSFGTSDNCLLVGGRTSPGRALADCWFKSDGHWRRVEDLPVPLYRHCAVFLGPIEALHGVLVYGGRSTGGKILNSWFIWHESRGWTEARCEDATLTPRFGAAMSANLNSTKVNGGNRSGFLLGGMGDDGIVIADLYEWTLLFDGNHFQVTLKRHLHESLLQNTVYRFGAYLMPSENGAIVVGGISPRGLVPVGRDIIELSILDSTAETFSFLCSSIPLNSTGSLPLLIGHSVTCYNGDLIIVGGGLNCFSFGTYMNEAAWQLVLTRKKTSERWQVLENVLPVSKDSYGMNGTELTTLPPELRSQDLLKTSDAMNAEAVGREKLSSPERFKEILDAGVPLIFEGADIGPCVSKWTTDYLKRKMGQEHKIVIHKAQDRHMSFQDKNFTYVPKAFGDFLDEVEQGDKQYFRSLSGDRPSEKAANLLEDFAAIASDFRLPDELQYVGQDGVFHSSILRISGPVTMWLHYDVMANVLCQIRGAKRIILFPPSDVGHLQIAPGESSSSLNVFDPTSLEAGFFRNTHPQEADLQAGDILFIPPMWCHAASPQGRLSISLNVFFRDLQHGYAAGRDVYGNRDLQAYADGRRDLLKMAARLQKLPPAIASFYAERLAAELRERVSRPNKR